MLFRSLTELTCWRQRPRPRAVHASAIHSAGAPGGTHEPAPLTRLPSRPRYGAIRRCRTRPDGTRGRSRTCVLWVQSPTGMPTTHDSCIGSSGRNRTCVGCVQSAAGMPATHPANTDRCPSGLQMNRRRLRHLPLKSMPGQGFLGVLGCCRVSLNLKRNERPRSRIEEDNGKGGTRTLDPGIMSAVL